MSVSRNGTSPEVKLSNNALDLRGLEAYDSDNSELSMRADHSERPEVN